ncbi:MAG TPA: lipase family protein, partial [Aquella sp.]|nr:lipase family protein [Aquella sp.]
GAILVPDVAKEKIKGVILFYHPTEVSKYNVPSCFMNAKNLPDYCQIGGRIRGSSYAMQLGGVFSAHGYVVVMPDYIGQGIDSSTMHPYMIYPQTNARSGLDMLKASRQLLKTLGIDDSVELNLYLSGYSEGGAYSLWASRLLQGYAKKRLYDNNFTLGLTVPISGAYDLSGAQIPFLFANVEPYPHADKYKALAAEELTNMKPVSATTYLTALAYYNFNQDYSTVLNPDFLSCGSYCKFGSNTYTIPELYTLISSDLTRDNIFAANKNAALDTINPDNNLAYGSENNSVRSFVADGITKNQIFSKVTKQADIISWKTLKPVTFINLDYDSVITPLNTQSAYNGLRKSSNKNLVDRVGISNFDYNTSINSKNPNALEPIDDVGCRVFTYIAALNEFNKVSAVE